MKDAIRLSMNQQIKDEGFGHLCEALKTNESLVTLTYVVTYGETVSETPVF